MIVDEAYFEFWGETNLALIGEFPNLVITRSFSKAFALAGLRCGYLVTDPRNVGVLEKIRNGKNINSLAQVAAIAALEDTAYLRAQTARLRENQRLFVEEAAGLGIPVTGTPANFVLIKVSSPEKVKKALEDRRILVRNRSHMPQLEGYLRITTGSRDEMAKCLETLSPLIKIKADHPAQPQAARVLPDENSFLSS